MSNSTLVFSDCFEYSKKALASTQMDEKALVDLMLQIDGKTTAEVKAILAESIAKLGGETGVAIAGISATIVEEAPKVEAAVLEVRDAMRKVEEVTAKCGWCVPKTTCS